LSSHRLLGLEHKIGLRATAVFAVFMVILLAMTATSDGTVLATPEDGYWEQTATDFLPFEWSETHSFSVSDGSATQTIVSPETGDVFRSQATWSSPKASYRGAETVELTLRLEIAEYVRNAKDDGYLHLGLNSVGDDIYARIDAPGMSPGSSTAGRTLLADASGEYIFGVRGSDGQKVVPSAGATVEAAFPAGYNSGEQRAIYVETDSGMARYTYTWRTGDEAPTTSLAGGETETTEVVVYDSRVRFKALKGQVEVCHPIGYTDWGAPIWDSPRKWVPADRGTRVLVGTIIRVPFGGSARLEHPYGWKVSLKSETMMTVGRIFTYESILPDTGLVETLEFFGMDYGFAHIDIVTLDEDTSVAITMKKAVVRVKGTQFVLEEDEATSIVKVMDGTVEVESTGDGTSELVDSGEMISATSDGLSERTNFDVDAEAAEWEALVADLESEDNEKGFPLWALILIIVVAVALLAAALAFFLLRRKKGRTHARQPSPMGYPPVQPVQAQVVQPAQPMTTDWHYTNPSGQQVGPFTWEQMFSLAQAGTLTSNSLIWHPTLSQWVPAGQYGELFSTTGANP